VKYGLGLELDDAGTLGVIGLRGNGGGEVDADSLLSSMINLHNVSECPIANAPGGECKSNACRARRNVERDLRRSS
jgi:hypothetical protein